MIYGESRFDPTPGSVLAAHANIEACTECLRLDNGIPERASVAGS